ncbi:MAG: serine hydrolase, partial [Chitinophagaceae bacterium]|nr:serine hydrolase [Chitinophagaceae bacterium]
MKLLLFTIILYSTLVFSQTEKTLQTDNQKKTSIDSLVNKVAPIYLQNPNTNGISIGIFYKGKKYKYNYGEVIKGSGKLPTADNFYNLGSVAKTFVTTILAEAVVEKRVKLTDDIRKYLPTGYSNLEYENYPIKLVDLANHTSGLPRQFHTFPASALDSLKKLGRREEINYYNTYDKNKLIADLYLIKPD